MKIIAYHVEPNVNNKTTYFKEQDDKFYHLQQLIDSKRKMLLDKQNKIKKISKQNNFLDGIRKDYNRYYNYIAEQKRDQIKALQMLDKYISDLSISGELSTQNIKDAKAEQKKILRELNNIKGSLDSIIDDTDLLNQNMREH